MSQIELNYLQNTGNYEILYPKIYSVSSEYRGTGTETNSVDLINGKVLLILTQGYLNGFFSCFPLIACLNSNSGSAILSSVFFGNGSTSNFYSADLILRRTNNTCIISVDQGTGTVNKSAVVMNGQNVAYQKIQIWLGD